MGSVDSFEQLTKLLAASMPRTRSSELLALRDALLERYNEAVAAMLFYGSSLRSGDALDGVVDLYLVVDDYHQAYRKFLPALFNSLLPPNVYYLEVEVEGHPVRAKYAVISMRDLERGTSPKWFHSYLWGRFSQPCELLYSRDGESGRRIRGALAQAVITFLSRVLPVLPARLECAAIWQQGLALSYQAELRAEKPERAIHLYEYWQDHYRAITSLAMDVLPFDVKREPGASGLFYAIRIPRHTRVLGRSGWLLRRFQGKLLSLLRLIKAVFTFQGGIDYIAWKLQRHTGIPIEVTPKMRTHPLLYSWGLVWRLYRRGVFR
jgi:Phosphatidate cytidylyltransferase, mitochondrial